MIKSWWNIRLSKIKDLGVKISIKVHYLFSQLYRLPTNLSDLTDVHGERFHQDIKVMREVPE